MNPICKFELAQYQVADPKRWTLEKQWVCYFQGRRNGSGDNQDVDEKLKSAYFWVINKCGESKKEQKSAPGFSFYRAAILPKFIASTERFLMTTEYFGE